MELQRRKVEEPELTPSARILTALRQQRIPFFRFAMNQSAAHRGFFEEHPLNPARYADFIAMSDQSIADQALMEDADRMPFDEYLEEFLQLEVP